MKLVQKFEIKTLDELAEKMTPFNHVINFIRFFDLHEVSGHTDKGKFYKFYEIRFVLSERALNL